MEAPPVVAAAGWPTYECTLRQLDDCLAKVTYVDEKVAYVIDPEGVALRFLRYGGGACLDRLNQADMEPERLRKACLASYRRGLPFTLSLGGAQSVETLWDPASFPKACFDRQQAFAYETWSALLRPEQGEETPEEFTPNSDFRVVLVTTSADDPPESLRSLVSVVTVAGKPSRRGRDPVAEAFGVTEVVRNSKALVEAAFDGDVAIVQQQLEQGYSVESVDGKKQTALSEAALQGHDEIVAILLAAGADPSAQCKKGRTPLYRAAFHSRLSTMTLLLEAGADPQIADTAGQWPANVCEGGHADAAKELLETFPRERTLELVAARLAAIEAARRARITTAAERELAARDSIRRELLELASAGDAAALNARLLQICSDADDAYPRERPRATAQVRDTRGHTLVSFLLYRYIIRESCSQFDSLPLTSLTISHASTLQLGASACEGRAGVRRPLYARVDRRRQRERNGGLERGAAAAVSIAARGAVPRGGGRGGNRRHHPKRRQHRTVCASVRLLAHARRLHRGVVRRR